MIPSLPPALNRFRLGICGLAAASGLLAQSPARPPETPETAAVVLNPFVITAEGREGYFSKSATAIGRVAQQLENIPQRIEIYNSQFLADLSPTTFQDILRYSSAVTFTNSERNSAGGSVRGFDFGVPLRNGVSMAASGTPVAGVEVIEQVEVVKGAAAVLYGASQPGGVVNYVTKKPLFRRETSVKVGAFSQGGYSASLDTSGPVGFRDKAGRETLAYRLIAAREDRKLYQINNDYFKRNLLFGAVSWKPLTALSFDLEAETSRLQTSFFNSLTVTRAQSDARNSGAITARQVVLPYNLAPVDWTYQDNNAYRLDSTKFAQPSVTLTKDFGRFGSWSMRALYAWREYSADRVLVDLSSSAYMPQPVTAADVGKTVNFSQAVSAADVAVGRLWIPGRYARRIEDRPVDIAKTQWDLTGKVVTGPLAHTLLFGTDKDLGARTKAPGNEAITRERQAFVGAAGTPNAIWVDKPDTRTFTAINWNDVQSATNPTGIVTREIFSGAARVDTLKAEIPFLTAGTNALYVFDDVGLWSDRIHLSLGARHDDLSQIVGPVTYTAKRWTYRYGAVFKITPALSVFALHNESFLPNPQSAAQAFNRYIAPQSGTHEEAGLRASFWKNRLTLEASVYKISNTNVVQNDPFGNVGIVPPDPRNNYKFVDGLSNKGYDLDAKVNLTADTQLIASYAHYNAYAAGNPAQVAAGIARFEVNNLPKDQLTLWGKWSVPVERLRGLALRLGYRYMGERPAGGIGSPPSLWLNSYSLVDIGAGYTWKKWDFDIIVRNVFDRYAFSTASALNRIYPEKPRDAALTIRTRF
jgi:outer membrane receptor protein involved in Fe transport